MKKKDQIKYYNFVSKILWEEWDPIGINESDGPKDEYDGYVPELVRMLDRGEELHQTAKRLEQFATVSMGISNANSEHNLKIASILIDGFADL